MDADFPAAHSMDTQWFAIDAEGCVGYFVTGEPGPVPIPAKEYAIPYSDSRLEKLFLAAPQLLLENSSQDPKQRHVGAEQPPASLARPPWHAEHYQRRRAELQAGAGKGRHLDRIGMLLRSRRLLEQIDPKRYEVAKEFATASGSLLPVFFNEPTIAEYRLLHDSGECVACVDLGFLFESPERFGVFMFSADDHYTNGPYELHARPSLPMVAERLPPEIRKIVSAMKFQSLRFGDAQFLQPLEHVPCVMWGGDEYMASDGRTILPVPEDKRG